MFEKLAAAKDDLFELDVTCSDRLVAAAEREFCVAA